MGSGYSLRYNSRNILIYIASSDINRKSRRLPAECKTPDANSQLLPVACEPKGELLGAMSMFAGEPRSGTRCMRWRWAGVMQDWLEAATRALEQAVIQEAESRPAARRLMERRGVPPVMALAFAATIRHSKQIVSCLGLNRRESSSGGKQRLGSTSKATPCCGSYWWKPRRLLREGIRNCGRVRGTNLTPTVGLDKPDLIGHSKLFSGPATDPQGNDK